MLINTVRGMAIDRVRRLRPACPAPGRRRAVRSWRTSLVAQLHAVYHSYAATGLPIVGMGGVASARDCLELMAAGACVVGLGTALFRDPALPRRIVAELPALLADHGFSGVEGVTGASQNLDSKAPPELERSER